MLPVSLEKPQKKLNARGSKPKKLSALGKKLKKRPYRKGERRRKLHVKSERLRKQLLEKEWRPLPLQESFNLLKKSLIATLLKRTEKN